MNTPSSAPASPGCAHHHSATNFPSLGMCPEPQTQRDRGIKYIQSEIRTQMRSNVGNPKDTPSSAMWVHHGTLSSDLTAEPSNCATIHSLPEGFRECWCRRNGVSSLKAPQCFPGLISIMLWCKSAALQSSEHRNCTMWDFPDKLRISQAMNQTCCPQSLLVFHGLNTHLFLILGSLSAAVFCFSQITFQLRHILKARCDPVPAANGAIRFHCDPTFWAKNVVNLGENPCLFNLW